MQEYFVGTSAFKVRITTSLDLGTQEEGALSLPYYGKPPEGKHYIFAPGRADHAGKYRRFMERVAGKGHHVWCIDPHGQGGTDGGVLCHHFDEDHEKPCCKRKGHGIWEDYADTYMMGVSAIANALRYHPNIGKKEKWIYPDLTLIAHSQGANVDMWARLHPEHGDKLKKWINEVHYIAPMISYTLFLKPYVGTWGEEFIRSALSWMTWGLKIAGYGESYLLGIDATINPFKLTHRLIADKIHVSQRDAFIKACQENPKFEIGGITNGWFLQANKACKEIRGIGPERFKGQIHVHIPGGDRVVYPHRIEGFFEKNLKDAYTVYEYENEPHSLFWGSEKGVKLLVENITSGDKQ